MIDRNELEDRLLAELQEAGEENIPTLGNTVCDPVGSDDEFGALQQALASLITASAIRVALENMTNNSATELNQADSEMAIAELANYLIFDEKKKSWTGKTDVWPTVFLTDLGRGRGRQILKTRGYRWWSVSQ